jgi:hypothetical protein
MPKLHYSRATTGEKVAECLLDPADSGLIGDLVSEATQQGAGLLWVHSRADLSGAGFTARPGFHEFRADPCPSGGEELPVLPDEVVLGLLPRTVTGQWGHKEPDPEWAVSPEGAWLGLRSGEEWIGLCRVEAERRAVDGPGFVPAARTDDGVRRLVLAAGARLGPGPVIVETWGEDRDPYLAAGFELTERNGGWELILPG